MVIIYIYIYIYRTDSSIYKGLWKDNLQDGKGTFINSEGERQIAIWSKGEVKKLIC